MNRTPLKAYAPKARRQFRQAITDQAARIGISAHEILPLEIKGDYAIVGGRAFPRAFATQREKLETWIARDGFDAVVDEVSYTWFNRLMAIRFMEANGYLSHGYKVLGHAEGRHQPQILVEAEHVKFIGLDAAKVTQFKIEGDRDEELYQLLLLEQCHELHLSMPFLFERISDASELLLPQTLLHSDSIVSTLVAEIPEELWHEIEIIGWLYQFYISERKDEVIGKVVASPDIPAATQLFTPNWIVKYMTQNSLGRQWLATYPDSPLRAKMDYYIESAPQSAEVTEALRAATPSALELESLTLLDPACGSGHILVEAYDLFKEMYLERGYRLREIPRLILENNLFGLDIDPRAAQMAGFAVLMKGRADDRRLLDDPPHLNIHAVRDGGAATAAELAQALAPSASLLEQSPLETDLAALLDFYEGARTVSSLLQVPLLLESRLCRLRAVLSNAGDDLLASGAKEVLQPLITQTELLAKKYDCVVANPPYMGTQYQNLELKAFAKKHFQGFEKDLFSAFIVRSLTMTKPNGKLGFMSPFVWMFISSYEELRRKLIDTATISTLVQLEYSGFDGATVPVCTFTIDNCVNPDFRSCFIKLSEFRGAEKQSPKTLEAIKNRDCGWFYEVAPKDFEKVPGSPIAYWASNALRESFCASPALENVAKPRQGMATTNNNLFLRLWFEVPHSRIGFGMKNQDEAANSGRKWFPYNKGGEFRKWYGNNEFVVNFQNNGREVCDYIDNTPGAKVGSNGRVINREFYFHECITWTAISSAAFSCRHSEGAIFSNAGMSIFGEQKKLKLIQGILNSVVGECFLRCLSPTLNFGAGEVGRCPITERDPSEQHLNLIDELVGTSKSDWDAFETSWDFARSPLLDCDTLEGAFGRWESETQARRVRLRELETENNRLFIAAYGLEDELTPEVPDEQITLARANREADLKRLVSYALGCLMGRYSLDEPGLAFAGAGGVGFDPARYQTLPADADGILPLTDAHWFDDDLVARLVEFLRAAYGPEHFEANLAYLAESVGTKTGETPEETLRRYLVSDFYRDHLRTYRNRPIYWLFSSGREKAFGALVYLHRFNASTLSRMRTEYVLPLLGRYQSRISQLDADIANPASTAARRAAEREKVKRQRQLLELQSFDEKLRHRADERFALDLDDGVRVNYAKFAELLSDVNLVSGSKE